MEERYRVIVKHESGLEEEIARNIPYSHVEDEITAAWLSYPEAEDIWEEEE